MPDTRVRRASALIAFLGAIALTGQAQSPSARASLHGRVVAAGTGVPLRHARVQATIANETVPPALTDADGRFVVTSVVDGPSRFSVTKPGYLATMVAASRIDEEVEVRMPKAGAISGRIVDTSGDPVMGMTVTAEVPGAVESARKVVATCQTDDLGDYRLAGLPEGSYLVHVNSVPPPEERRRERRVYYPGVHATAQPIALRAGEELWAIDFPTPAWEIDAAPRRVLRFDGVIRGRVFASDGRALPRASIGLETTGKAPTPPVMTDQEGRYEFLGLSAASYTVRATKDGFIATQYGQRPGSDSGEPIELRSGEARSNVDIALPRLSAITGRVLDDAGEPVEGASVHVLQVRYVEGRRRLVDAGGQGTRRTDDRGVYRIYGLPPGAYIAGATVGQLARTRSPGYLLEPMTDVPGYTTSYFPGTAQPGEAQGIAVDLAQDVSGIDFALVRAPTARIAGTIVDSAGNPVRDGLILAPSRRSGVLATSAVGAQIDPDGRFEFPNVAPGEYVIQASRGDNNPYDEGESASQFVAVAGTDITGVTIRMSRGSTLRGQISFDGDSSTEAYFAVDVQAVPVDMDLTPQNLDPASAQIQPDGTFEMAGLSGPRVLRLTQAPRDWTLKAVLLNGRDITDTPLSFGTAAQSIDGLEVVLTDRVSEVIGHARDARGRGVADATVIVFSTDRRLWGEASRFLASARTTKDGAFSVRNLPPGDYHAAAVTQVTPDEWRDPDLLDALVPSVTHVIISEGETVTAALRTVTR